MRVKRLLWAFATVLVTVLVIGLVFGFNDLKIGQEDVKPPVNEAEEPADLLEDEPEEEPEPEVVSITLSAAGDVTLGNTQLQGYDGTFVEMYDNEGPEYFLSGVLPVFSEDDMTLVNFEGVLTEATEKMEKEFNLKGSPEYMQILNAGSVECVAFSNNHYMDYFEEGFNDTIDGFNNYGITYASDDVVAIYEVKGIKMGVIAVNTSHGETVKDTVEAGLSKLTEAGANVKIVYIHWGVELDHYPQSKHVDLGHDFVDMGADLVLGAHPHVPQGIEMYKGKVICYSLGNFCFGGNKNPKRKDTFIYQQTFTLVDGELQDDISAKVIPCTISSVDSRNDFKPTLQTGDRYKSILSDLTTYSKEWGTEFDEDGNIITK